MNIIYFLVVFFEWFTTLSVEIISIRKCMSIVWSNSIITSIILWVILVALSYWYYVWWKIASNSTKEKVIKLLFFNLLVSSFIYTAISFPFENILLSNLLSTWLWYSLSILFSTSILFFVPVFLASQTIPLVNELINSEKKSELIWKLLFYSTIWSFVWSISSSIIFFPLIGVTKTIILNWLVLAVLALIVIIYNKKYFKEVFIFINVFIIILYSYLICLDIFNKNVVYSFSSTHNDIEIVDYDDNKRMMMLNWAFSSWIYKDSKESFFTYIIETQNIINELRPKNVLVIWWAWFSLPYNISKLDFIENIDVCDIDESMYDISQKYFLEESFNTKIKFYSEPARYLVNKNLQSWIKYDFIFIDAYAWKSVPSQLLTKEFYDWLNKISNWTIVFNYIFDQSKNSNFYKKIVNTLNSSFEDVYIKWVYTYIWKHWNFLVVNKKYNSYKKVENFKNIWIYTDDKWTQEIDKYMLFKED